MKKKTREYIWFSKGKWRRKEEIVEGIDVNESLVDEVNKERLFVRKKVRFRNMMERGKSYFLAFRRAGFITLVVFSFCAFLFFTFSHYVSFSKQSNRPIGQTFGSLALSDDAKESIHDTYQIITSKKHALSVIRQISEWQSKWLSVVQKELSMVDTQKQHVLLYGEWTKLQKERERYEKEVLYASAKAEGEEKVLYDLLLARMHEYDSFLSSFFLDMQQQDFEKYKKQDDQLRTELAEQLLLYAKQKGLSVKEENGEFLFSIDES